MSKYDSEINGLADFRNIDKFVDVVVLYKYSKYDIRVYESIKGTAEAISNIFANSEDDRLKETVCKSFEKYKGIFHAKSVEGGYKAVIDLEHIPTNVCKQYIAISNWIKKQMKNDARINKQRGIKLSKMEIKLRQKANLSIFNKIQNSCRERR